MLDKITAIVLERISSDGWILKQDTRRALFRTEIQVPIPPQNKDMISIAGVYCESESLVLYIYRIPTVALYSVEYQIIIPYYAPDFMDRLDAFLVKLRKHTDWLWMKCWFCDGTGVDSVGTACDACHGSGEYGD